MKNYNKLLIAATVLLFVVNLILAILKIKFYNWSFWIVPVFYHLFIVLIIKFLNSKKSSQILTSLYTQITVLKLIVLLLFILIFKLFLDKRQWINFVFYNIIAYLIYTAIEIKALLSSLRQED